MSDLDLVDAAWRPWIEDVCAAVGVDPALVDVHEIHGLTRVIAHEFTRPMAPVSAYVWGLARASHPDADAGALLDGIIAAIPDA